MIGLQFHNLVPTKASLNGPFLRFVGTGTTQPFSTSICSGAAATFIGFSTAFFPTQDPPLPISSNVGILTYRWYEVGVGPLSDSANVTGSATTTLTISNVRTPQDSNRQFFLRSDYIASSGENFVGNALNEPVDSSVATLTVFPNISITTQPSLQIKAQNETATFSVEASSTDSSQGTLNYQWTFDGNNLSDGTFQTTTLSPIPGYSQFNQTYTTATSSVTIPSNAIDIKITVAGASGGRGAADFEGSGGLGGGGIIGNFSVTAGQTRTLTLNCGSKGSDGNVSTAAGGGAVGTNHSAEGGRGGNAGEVGFSGGGGGGGGASIVSDSSLGNIIVAGGGAGGGGGSQGRSGLNGGTGGNFNVFTPSSNLSVSAGGQGQDKSGAGAGGGGGGGGVTLPSGSAPGGSAGTDNVTQATGGTGGGSNYNSGIVTWDGNTGNYNRDNDGFINVRYKYPTPTTPTEPEVPNTTTISGSRAKDLSITSDLVGLGTIGCIVSNSVACNSPIFSSAVDYTVVPARSIIYYEEYNDDSIAALRTGTQNLSNGPLNLFTDPSNNRKNIIITPTEKNVIARITLAAAAGLANAGNRGGAGGVTVFQYTLLKDVEYNFILGFSGVNRPGGVIGGGVGAYFYDRAKVAICCGGGGGAGTSARGGDGGGAGVAGERGSGSGPGNGGARVINGQLPFVGSFAGGSQIRNFTERTGGVLSACIIGDSFFQTRYSPCDDIGSSVQALSNTGGTILGSAFLRRGYKPGLSYRNNAGNGSGINGGGGQGAIGGDGAISGGSGGGGGSGYSSGDAVIINATLGGNPNSSGYAIIQLI